MNPRLRMLGLVALLIALLRASPVAAHADLSSSIPADGAQLTSAPSQVVLVFTEELKPTENEIRVTHASGAQVDRSDTTLDKRDPDRRTIFVSLKPDLTDGIYTVNWKNNGADGHAEEGSFRFSIAAATPSSAPVLTQPTQLPATGDVATDLRVPSMVAILLIGAGMVLRRRKHAHG